MPHEMKPDIIAALRGNPHAHAEWDKFSPEQQAQKLDWIEGADSAEARMRRLSLLIEQLSLPE